MAEPEGWSDAGYLCRGVSWSDRRPHLDLLAIDDASARSHPLTGERLGVRLISPGPFCLGYSGTADDGALDRFSCPRQAYAASGRQCEECAARDEFRFAHHAHLGGYVTGALAAYLAQPHWVYVATFADGTSKVGTASGPRKAARLDEQGAAHATYVAHVPNGRVARVFEDAITERAEIAQTKRRAAKVAALTDPAPADLVASRHEAAVARAEKALAPQRDRPGVTLPHEPWARPAVAATLFDGVPVAGWPPYSHDLRAGEHGFHIDAVAGSTALARLRDDIDAARYVVDLGALIGCRITIGPYTSRPVPVQMSLF